MEVYDIFDYFKCMKSSKSEGKIIEEIHIEWKVIFFYT